MDTINENIAKKLKHIRKTQGLSLDKVAELTGVSKAMLGQIERGVSNPTVSILWKIAKGLKVSFSSFVEEEKPDVTMVHFSSISPITESNGHFKVYPIFPFKEDKKFEIYTICLDTNSEYVSEAHTSGVEEYIMVTEGILELRIDTETYTISEGDSIHFRADKPHTYRNKSSKTLRFQNLIFYHP
ncbi:helix-turn-helix domain-containing protein [Caldalkalibacillus mannanilyticus]|uniref:helix-turn-helix domain-containing protein n=1 Tax=Caldalkalibacillus mannanilyticus TaxID=1418 RepID=UPI000469B3BC|nr:XRE family transcriptional regulator [Caldalkalibacillus mannanilyticus]